MIESAPDEVKAHEQMPQETTNPALILASTSRYRAELLGRLGLPFTQHAPGTEEDERDGESPRHRAARLALAKARDLSKLYPDQWVIGSDQVAYCGRRILHKPGTADNAVSQLERLSGRKAGFATAIALVHGASATEFQSLDMTQVRFRKLGQREIRAYVARDTPLDCAGSFRCESLGIALFQRIESKDPTALIGLPLIVTAKLLRQAGFQLI